MAKTSTKPSKTLADHAGAQDTIEFTAEVRSHGIRFFPGTVAKFEVPEVAAYFDVAFNCAAFTTKKANVTITADEINMDPDAPGATIDPDTVIGRGREGIEAGTSVAGHLNGGSGDGQAVLVAQDSTAGAEG